MTGDLGLRWRQMRFNPLRSLTPERLAAALDQHAAGWLREAALIFETIEQRDAICRSVISKRKAAVSRRPWQIVTSDPDNPVAEAHKKTLEHFYDHLEVTDATDENVRTGVSGLLRQMLDSIVQRYAVHEIVWKPDGHGLTAQLRRVPLYFFENRSGRLRFIGPETRADGVPLEEGGWMVTVAEGIGEALSVCWMFRRLGIQDLLAFSEKFSIPGVLGRTSAKEGTPEAEAMRRSLSEFVSSWVGLITGDDGSTPDPIKILSAPGGASLPQKELAEYMDRMISALVRGADLGTLSRAHSEGASLQAKETEALLEDDCALVTEVLQTQLDRLVIRMVHGDERPLANIVVAPPSSQNTSRDLEIDTGLSKLGVRQNPEDLAERYGRTLADEDGPDDFDPLIDAFDEDEEPGDDLVAEFSERGDPLAGAFAGNAATDDPRHVLQRIRAALADDLRPLGDALWSAHETGDVIAMRAALRKISERAPDFLESGALEDLLGEEMIAAWSGGDLAENSGTSEGARKGWETRRRNGWRPKSRGGPRSWKKDQRPKGSALPGKVHQVGSIREVLDSAWADGASRAYAVYQTIDTTTSDAIARATGLPMDLSGMRRIVTAHDANHIMLHQGDDIPLTEEDVLDVMNKLQRPLDQVWRHRGKKPPTLKSTVMTSRGELAIVEERQIKQGVMALKTIHYLGPRGKKKPPSSRTLP